MAYAHNGSVRLYWRADGAADRPALLLLHAIGTDLALWDRAVPYLATQFRLLRMDIRGHGASDAPTGEYRLEQLAEDALAVLDAARVARANVCGISLGGMIAMRLALDAPGRLDALICACSAAQMDRQIWETRLHELRAGGMAAIAPLALQRFLSAAFARSHPEIVDGLRATLLATSPDGYAGCGAAIRDMQLLEELARIRLPTLVISGERDISTPFQPHGAQLLAAIPGARHVSLDAAHLACVESPAAFATAIGQLCRAQPLPGQPDPQQLEQARETLFEAGLTVRRRVLGDAWVDRALRERTAFNADYQALITRYAWQEIWGRPGLDQRTRRLLVIAMTVALGRWEEFRLHVRAGLAQAGFSREELQEVLLQSAIYAGVPAANTAFAQAAAVIEELAGG